MSNSKTDFNTITDDMMTSLRLAGDNFLTFFLAGLGMAALAILMIVAMAIPLAFAAAAIVFSVDPTFWANMGPGMMTFATANPYLIVGLVALVALPVVGVLTTVVGAIYGISKEVVEDGETKAENAFSWVKRRFLAFAGAGIIQSLVVVGPIFLLSAAISLALGGIVTGVYSVLLGVFAFVWVFVTGGLLSMMFPAIVDGKNPIEALRVSVKLGVDRFDRVFGIWTAYIVLFAAMAAPAFIVAYGVGFTPGIHMTIPIVTVVAGGWTALAGLLLVAIVLPSMILARARVYAVLTGKQLAAPKALEVPIV
ncbi:MAG: hypothetical protein GQ580_03160 [Candidatus Thorarchaeota archaeon]|nr:hypothetical protein [Candidatus Thorarchaeota archaeon]